MDQGERRVRRLILQSRDDTLLTQARYRLEEAFRTASLPGLPPHAQLLVRRLDLGTIHADQPPALLANRIGGLMRTLATAAACVDHRSAATADAVWFSDPLQPYKVLLLRLLDGGEVREWYWRTLFPRRTLALNSGTIGMILSHAAATPLQGLAPARLLEAALEPRRLGRLFACITPALARQLLHEQGVSANAETVAPQTVRPAGASDPGAISPVAAPNLSLPWRGAIREAVLAWGAQDVRTLWLAWHALIGQQPAWLERKEVLQRIVPGAWLQSWTRTTADMAAGKETAPVRGSARERPGLATGHPRPESTTVPGPESDAVDAHLSGPSLPERPAGTAPVAVPVAAAVGSAGPAPVDLGHRAGPPAASPSTLSPVADDGCSDLPRPATVKRHGPDPSLAAAPTSPGRSDAPGAGLPRAALAPFSPHAGFALVIAVFQRLGMAELLASNEQLVALDLPRQLLWSLALRSGMTALDPLLPLFAGFEAAGDAVIAPFCPPDRWPQETTVSGRPLNAPAMAAKDGSIQLHGLIKLLQLLAALYLRRHCGLSLRALVQRPGRVVLTATHWDVIFDLNQVDLRLRRMALDSDPGWVAWLGRVVQFHYDREGERYV